MAPGVLISGTHRADKFPSMILGVIEIWNIIIGNKKDNTPHLNPGAGVPVYAHNFHLCPTPATLLSLHILNY